MCCFVNYTLRNKQYLYFLDHWKKLYLSFFGMVAFLSMNLVHVIKVINCLFNHEINQHCIRGYNELTTFEYLMYNILAISSCAVIVLAKISEDLFIQLNRDRAIVKISIFQYDFLRDVDRQDFWKIKILSSNDPSAELLDKILQISNSSYYDTDNLLGRTNT